MLKYNSAYYCCLFPLLYGLGWKGDETIVQNALPYELDTFGITELIKTMTNLDLKVNVDKINLKKGHSPIMPCLLITRLGDPKVLLSHIGDKFLCFDGVSEKFEQIKLENKSENLLYFYKDEDDSNNLLYPQQYWFFKFLNRFKGVIAKAFIVSFLLSLLSLASPMLVMTIYGQISMADMNSKIGYFGIGIVIIALAFMGFTYLRSYILNYIGLRMSYIINTESVRRVIYMQPSLSAGATLGSQLSRLKDFESIKSFFTGVGFTAVLDLPFVIILIFAIYLLGGYIALVPVISIMIFILLGLIYGPLTKKINSLNSTLGKDKNDFVYETVSNLSDLFRSGLKEQWLDRYKKMNIHSILSTRDSAVLTNKINVATTSVVSISAIATIAIGVRQVMAGELSTGALMAIILILWKVLNPLKSFFSILAQFDKIKSSVRQIDRFMALPLEKQSFDFGEIKKKTKGLITFSQVSLRYTPDSYPALLGVSFKVNENETLAIYGHSGSGKSTIVKLILGMLDAQTGRISIDKMNIRQINPLRLRKSISYCPQNSQIFNDTIWANLRNSYPSVLKDDVIKISKIFDIYNEIDRLEEGVFTKINMDSGEYVNPYFLKRLSLVRTFIKPSPIYLLDDITKDLTPLGEERSYLYLNSIKGNKTIIFTTSNLSFFDVADKALWLERGRVKMFGNAQKVKEAIKSSYKRGLNGAD